MISGDLAVEHMDIEVFKDASEILDVYFIMEEFKASFPNFSVLFELIENRAGCMSDEGGVV